MEMLHDFIFVVGILAILFCIGVVGNWVMNYRPSRRWIINTLRLNQLFGVKRTADLSYEELKQEFMYNVFPRIRPYTSIVRNGFTLTHRYTSSGLDNINISCGNDSFVNFRIIHGDTTSYRIYTDMGVDFSIVVLRAIL